MKSQQKAYSGFLLFEGIAALFFALCVMGTFSYFVARTIHHMHVSCEKLKTSMHARFILEGVLLKPPVSERDVSSSHDGYRVRVRVATASKHFTSVSVLVSNDIASSSLYTGILV